MAVREGMAKPVERPKQATGSEKPKEDGAKISQKNSAYLDDRGQKTVWNHSEVYQSGRFSGTSVTIQWQNFYITSMRKEN